MHMADALISPAVGGTLWAASAGLMAYASHKIRTEFDSSLVPLMGVLGAFVFAAQMINFTIPGTGSSGHLGGGLLLAAVLGPHAAFVTIASVLVVQALFFADGGLLALGCNIFNLGFFPCYVAFPVIYKLIAGSHPTKTRLTVASILGAVVGLQLGAFAVVLETVASGITALSFGSFVMLMQPIHLAIGVVEGLVTAVVVNFVYSARPEILHITTAHPTPSWSITKVASTFAVLALLVGGVLSWFASAYPDGLEWSIAGVTGSEELESPATPAHAALARVQERTAFMPDYALKPSADANAPAANTAPVEAESNAAWPAVDAGTSVAGIVGGLLTLLLAGALGLLLRRRPTAQL